LKIKSNFRKLRYNLKQTPVNNTPELNVFYFSATQITPMPSINDATFHNISAKHRSTMTKSGHSLITHPVKHLIEESIELINAKQNETVNIQNKEKTFIHNKKQQQLPLINSQRIDNNFIYKQSCINKRVIFIFIF
jgi:hypothetical protein